MGAPGSGSTARGEGPLEGEGREVLGPAAPFVSEPAECTGVGVAEGVGVGAAVDVGTGALVDVVGAREVGDDVADGAGGVVAVGRGSVGAGAGALVGDVVDVGVGVVVAGGGASVEIVGLGAASGSPGKGISASRGAGSTGGGEISIGGGATVGSGRGWPGCAGKIVMTMARESTRTSAPTGVEG